MSTAKHTPPHSRSTAVQRRLCGARRTRAEDTRTCPAGWGTDHPGAGRSKLHGGASPTGRKAAQLEQARGSLQRLGVPMAGVNPLDLLGELVDQSAAVGAWWREQVAALPAVLTEYGPHPLVRLHGTERDRAARVAREAVALGLEERRVRLGEGTRAQMTRVFLGALADAELGLSAEQLQAAPRVAARLIRAAASPHEHDPGALPGGRPG